MRLISRVFREGEGGGFSRHAICSARSVMASSACFAFSASQRSGHVPKPVPLRIFGMVIKDTPDPLRRQDRLEAVAATGGAVQRLDLFDGLRRGRLRGALVDRRQVLRTLEAVGLEPPFAFLEAGAVHASSPARLRDIAQLPGQFQHVQARRANFATTSRDALFFAVDGCPL